MRRLTSAILFLLLAVPLGAQTVAPQPSQGALGASGTALGLDVTGMGTATITISGTYSGTVSFEGASNPNVSPVAVACWVPNTPGTLVSSTTSTGTWQCNVSGLRYLQARMSSYSSGTASAFLTASVSGGSGGGGGTSGVVAQGSTTSGQSGMLTQGAVTTATPSYSTGQTNPISLDTSGGLRVNCITGCGGSGGTAIGDNAAFTQGLTQETPAAGFFTSGAYAAPTTGHATVWRMTSGGEGYLNLTSIGGTAFALGQTTMSASLPVAIASNQSAVATSLPSTQNTNLANIDSATSRLTSSAEGISPGSVGATTSLMFAGIFNTTQPTFTTGQRGAIQLSSRGAQLVATGVDTFHVTCDSGCSGSGGTSSNFGSAFPSAGTAVGFKDSTGTNMAAGNLDASGNVKVAIAAGGSNTVTDAGTQTAGASSVATVDNYNFAFNGTTYGRVFLDACNDANATISTVSFGGKTANFVLKAGTSAKKDAICGFSFVSTAAESYAIVEGTGSTCGTGTAAVLFTDPTTPTAANGAPVAANGGLNNTPTTVSIATTATNADDLCLLKSGSGIVSGWIKVAVR